MDPEDEVSAPENAGVVINVENTPDPEPEETEGEEQADVTVVEASPTIIVNAAPDVESREEIEQEVREEQWRDQRIAELEQQVAELTAAAAPVAPEVEVSEVVADNDEFEVSDEDEGEDEEQPERGEPKSARPHALFRGWRDWFGKDK